MTDEEEAMKGMARCLIEMIDSGFMQVVTRCLSETHFSGGSAGLVRRKLCELETGHQGPHRAYADDEHYWEWQGTGRIETPNTKLMQK